MGSKQIIMGFDVLQENSKYVMPRMSLLHLAFNIERNKIHRVLTVFILYCWNNVVNNNENRMILFCHSKQITFITLQKLIYELAYRYS